MNTSGHTTVQFCIACNLLFNSKKEFNKHKLTNEHIQQLERYLGEEVDDVGAKNITFTSDKIVENVDGETWSKTHKITNTNNMSEDNNITKDNTITNDRTITKSKTKTEDDIYSRIKYNCKECNEIFRNKIAPLITLSYSRNKKNLENTKDYEIRPSLNMREFCITG